MIKGIGIDIAEVIRFQNTAKKNGKALLERIFTKEELNYARGLKGTAY